MIEKYIFKKENKYLIKRTFNDIEYNFGTYDSIEEAKKRLEQLDNDGWPISTKNINKHLNERKSIGTDNDKNFQFDIKVGKAFKHGFLVLKRKECYELFPKISYENECDIILDGIESKARLNFVPRLVIDRKNEKLIEHLKKLSELDPNQRKIVTLIKQNEISNSSDSDEYLIEENKKLKEKIQELTNQIENLYNFTKNFNK